MLKQSAAPQGPFEAIVYYVGARSQWAGKPHEAEIIYRRVSRFRSLAIGLARGRARGLIGCLWAVRSHGLIIDGQVPAKTQL